ncbi:MAG: putative toxin-antitoxin system toxin component, PIN family [Prevotella sp.]|nr:putative toxin-antitoxin system toxin component, PIN family [Prevotella sp.]
MRIIFDNNIWISFLIGKRLSALRSAFSRKDVEIFFCDELKQEFLDVAHRPKIQKYVDERQVLRVHQLMTLFCHGAKASIQSVTPVRNPKDVYLLALADAVKADFLVSGDSDLTDLQQHNQTKIIDFREIPQLIAAEEKG